MRVYASGAISLMLLCWFPAVSMGDEPEPDCFALAIRFENLTRDVLARNGATVTYGGIGTEHCTGDLQAFGTVFTAEGPLFSALVEYDSGNVLANHASGIRAAICLVGAAQGTARVWHGVHGFENVICNDIPDPAP